MQFWKRISVGLHWFWQFLQNTCLKSSSGGFGVFFSLVVFVIFYPPEKVLRKALGRPFEFSRG